MCRWLCGLLAALVVCPAWALTVAGSAAYRERIAQLPATFVGDLPGAGGSTVRWHLDLLDGARYQLRRTFVDQPAPNVFDAIGRVARDRGGRRLRLVGTQGADAWFEVPGAQTLRALDLQGRTYESGAPQQLVRVEPAEPIEPQLALSGMFTDVADAARIVVCADGRTLAVAMEGAMADQYRALESAYGLMRTAPGQPLLVELTGQIAARPATEGRRDSAHLVVQQFGAAWPRETCGQPLASSPLRHTAWRLVRLEGRSIEVADRAREPQLVLQMQGGRVAGSGGCHRLAGAYELDGERLSFARVATAGTYNGNATCSEPALTQERAFVDALGRVQSHRIRGSHLDLLDAAGAVLARLESVALR